MRMLNEQDQFILQENLLPGIQRKRFTEEQLQLAFDRKWFNIWVPKEYSGLELPLHAGCQLLENLAYADGGFGWTVTLCSGANMFAGFIDPAVAKQVFSTREVCFGGSGQISGKAVKTADGTYLIDGQWKYATGAPHLSHFTLNAAIYEGDQPVKDVKGQPVYRSFFIDRDDVLIHYDWDTFGLEITASHSFSVSNLRVDASRAFDLRPERKTYDNPLFRYPFMTFAACTLVVNYIGMFKKFLHLFEKQLLIRSKDDMWAAKHSKALTQMLGRIETPFLQKVNRLYSLIDTTWDLDEVGTAWQEEIVILSHSIVAFIRTQTVALFPYTGISGAQRDNEINIVFRHLFTASQHGLLNM